jgi:putative ABC transport system permease protein
MLFALRMAGREARASWKRLLFFFLCVAVGVGAIVALRSVIQSVRLALAKEARTLIASDVLVQTNRPWTGEVRETIERRLAAVRVEGRTEAIETATMMRPVDPVKVATRMVELQGVRPGFPLYGAITLSGGQAFSHALLEGQGALVRPELLAALDVQVGDLVRIGDLEFTIRGVILTEPGRRLGAFSFGPRVLIDHDDLLRAGLLQFGSRARYRVMLKVPDATVDSLVAQLGDDFKDQFVSVRSYRGTEDQLGEDLMRAENYLSLVGFVMVVLGGIGVWSVTRVFVRQRMHSIAVLKCLGASTWQLLAVYVAQVVMLGLVGSGIGVGFAWLALGAVPGSVVQALGGATPGLTASAVVQGVGIGLLVSLLFALVPLLDVRRVKPLRLLRDESPFGPRLAGAVPSRWHPRRLVDGLRTADPVKAITTAGVVVALAALASWQAASAQVGLLVCAGFLIVAIALHLAASVLVRLVRPLRQVRWSSCSPSASARSSSSASDRSSRTCCRSSRSICVAAPTCSSSTSSPTSRRRSGTSCGRPTRRRPAG